MHTTSVENFMRVLKTITLATLLVCPSVSTAQISLPVVDTVTIVGEDIATTIDEVMATSNVIPTNADGTLNNDPAIYDVPAVNVGIVSSDPAIEGDPVVPTIFYDYVIRERANAAQLTRRIRSFLQFDVNAIPAADLADPNFSATFTVDYVGNLNISNTGLNVGLGQVVDAAWDSTTNLPAFDFSVNSTDLGLLIEDAAANPNSITGLTVDITSLVLGWADGSIPNFGLTFNVPAEPVAMGNASNSAYFANATIETSLVPMNAGGDFDGNGIVDCADLDGYVRNIGNPAMGPLAELDFDGNGTLDASDAAQHIATLVTTSNGIVGTFPGDLNCDGSVSVLGDALILVGNLNMLVSGYSQGDINFDGSVNVLGDALVLVTNLGRSNE